MRSTLKEPLDERFSRRAELLADLSDDCGGCADAEGIVSRDRNVVLAMLLRGESHVAARPSHHQIPQRRKRESESVAGKVPGQPHTAMSLSRTM